MADKLGIFVRSDKYLDHVIGLVRAAEARGIEVFTFFSHKGVLLTQDPKFLELGKTKAHLSLCNVGYEAAGLKGIEAPGVPETGYATQARNGAMIEECDRYVVM